MQRFALLHRSWRADLELGVDSVSLEARWYVRIREKAGCRLARNYSLDDSPRRVAGRFLFLLRTVFYTGYKRIAYVTDPPRNLVGVVRVCAWLSRH
jgi:hypothetical protein